MNVAPEISADLKPEQSINRRYHIGWPAFLFAILTLTLTYPVFWQVGQAVAGFDGRDSFQHVWYQWWMKETLLELGVWPDYVSHLYFPMGASHPVLALHPHVPLISLPLTVLFGPLISYNVAFLLSFFLSGLTGYLLCRYVSGDTGAAIIGGLIFAYYPNRVGHAAAGHLLLITNYLLPLYAISLLILLRRPSLKLAVWHGVVTGMLALSQPTHIGYGIAPVLLILGGGHIVNRLSAARSGRSSPAIPALTRSFSWLFLAGLLALMIFLPFAWPTLRQTQQGELAYLASDNLTEHATDLLAFGLPSPYNPILAPLGLIPAFGPSIIDGLRDLEEQLAYPGLIAVGLSILALWKRWPKARIWLALTAVCALLSLGPYLKIGGEVQSIVLPYTWLSGLPFYAWSRTPGRFNETVMLGVAVLASIGAAWLFEKIQKCTKQPGAVKKSVGVGLGLLLLLEYIVTFPFPTESTPISGYYDRLGQEVVSGGILEMPVTGSRRASNYGMYYQTIHEHPLAGGYIERDPPGTVELKEFLNQLLSPISEQTVLAGPEEQTRQAILADMKITRVILHPSLMTDQAARKTRDYVPLVLGSPQFKDEDTLVYPVQAGHRQFGPWQLLPDQENWEVVHNGAAFRLKKEGYLFIYAAEEGEANLRFQVAGPPQLTELSFRLNDTVTQSYAVTSTEDYSVGPLALRAGLNYFRLSTEPQQDLDFRKLAVESVDKADR